jgi:hypothetical protein
VSGLILVQQDGRTELHRRVGRFSLEREEASSERHLAAAVQRHQEKMISGLGRMGYQFSERHGFELRGPLPHIALSSDSTPDNGHVDKPDPRDLEGTLRWERAERARVARKVDQNRKADLVDYELVGTFVKQLPADYRLALHDPKTPYIPDRLTYLVDAQREAGIRF